MSGCRCNSIDFLAAVDYERLCAKHTHQGSGVLDWAALSADAETLLTTRRALRAVGFF